MKSFTTTCDIQFTFARYDNETLAKIEWNDSVLVNFFTHKNYFIKQQDTPIFSMGDNNIQ